MDGHGGHDVRDNGRRALAPSTQSAAFSGAKFLTANRLAPNPDASFPAAQTMGISQTVDVTSMASLIDVGDRFVDFSFAYNDADVGDNGVVSLSFLNSASALISQRHVLQHRYATDGLRRVGDFVDFGRRPGRHALPAPFLTGRTR